MREAGKAGVVRGEPFELVDIVEESRAPADGIPGTWYRYRITQGDSVITGLRQGSRQSVTLALEAVVEALNERRVGRRGRVHLTHPQRKKDGN